MTRRLVQAANKLAFPEPGLQAPQSDLTTCYAAFPGAFVPQHLGAQRCGRSALC